MTTRAHQILRAVARATEPTSEALARVRERVLAGLTPTTELLTLVDEADRADPGRVKGRFARRRPARLPMVVGLTGLAAAAAALWMVGIQGPADDSEPIQVSLDAAFPSPYAPSPWVHLAHDGRGIVTGVDLDWQVSWELGRIAVGVTPDQGVDLTVRTREAIVRVVGTAFDVNRDRLGTSVTVDAGRVDVDCVEGHDAVLTGGQQHACLPVSAAGLLGRAQALGERGEAPEDVLASIEQGLDRHDARGAVRAELLAAQIAPLMELEHPLEALAACDAYLGHGGPREQEVRRYAAHLALGELGCEAALPHLVALTDPNDEERAWRDRCRVP